MLANYIEYAGKFEGSHGIVLPKNLQPDFGPAHVDPIRGIATVGAVPWVVNHNVLLGTADMALARRIAAAVSSRGGGLSHVEAMALPHEAGEDAVHDACCSSTKVASEKQGWMRWDAGIEIACNLLDVAATSTGAVEDAVQAHAAAASVPVKGSYQTNSSPQRLCELADEALAANAALPGE